VATFRSSRTRRTFDGFTAALALDDGSALGAEAEAEGAGESAGAQARA
jgi:hypothetical protein